MLTRRNLLRSALIAGGTFNIATAWPGTPNLALKFAQLLNRARFTDLPPKAVEHASKIRSRRMAHLELVAVERESSTAEPAEGTSTHAPASCRPGRLQWFRTGRLG